MQKIIGERLKRLLREKKISQERFAEMVGVKREVISQLCNDKYRHVPKQATLDRIYLTLYNLGYGDAVHLYLSGEAEYNDIDSFSSDSTPARTYRATELIDDMLTVLTKSELTEDRRHFRVFGDSRSDFIDMNVAEYQKFKFYLVRQLEAACQNYIDICNDHDENSDSRIY